MAEEDAQTHTWQTRIDRDLRSQGERLTGVESSITNLSENFSAFTHAFEASNTRQRELSRTRWPLVLGVVSLIFMVLGAFLSGYLRDLNRVELNLKDVRSKRISEEDPAQNLRLTELERRMNRSEAADMDHRHADIRRGAEDGVRIQDMGEEIIGLRAEEHLALKARAATVERVRALERETFGGPGPGTHDTESGHGHGAHD